ncbi:MBL fold metallo-hydrolase [Undibacterium flavidum]|uniref:MBL fold metallo-hydrolase n=1 Tax=Undibacterium flavidum TaxID=2762297 RepID=A0ABR6YCT7_9BURK|nr:MBL fold metallo-hydrolase [Undibacterium flavidum]
MKSRRQFLQHTALATGMTLLSQAGFANAPAAPGMRLILLGTAGGPTPKKNRAAPAQMILIDGEAYVIDCGNGLAQQIIKAGIKLSAIRHVFLTHHHSDHNADYGNLMLLAWAADLDHRIDTYGPAPIKRMTQQFLALNEFDIKTRIQDEGRHPLKSLIVPHELKDGGLVMQNQQVKVTAAQVVHPPVTPAFAYRFEHQGKSIVISGDTSYSENLVRLAQGADVLVHEIMHTPSLDQLLATEPNATRLKEHLLASHSTAEQVGRVATAAKVKKLVLSHFVPGGYPYLDDSVWLNAVRPYFDGEILVGSDLMEIQV